MLWDLHLLTQIASLREATLAMRKPLTAVKFFILIFVAPYNFFHAAANFHPWNSSAPGKNYTIRLLFVLQCLEIKL
nr:hypothetical protein BSM_16090 [uncultured archaeon]